MMRPEHALIPIILFALLCLFLAIGGFYKGLFIEPKVRACLLPVAEKYCYESELGNSEFNNTNEFYCIKNRIKQGPFFFTESEKNRCRSEVKV